MNETTTTVETEPWSEFHARRALEEQAEMDLDRNVLGQQEVEVGSTVLAAWNGQGWTSPKRWVADADGELTFRNIWRQVRHVQLWVVRSIDTWGGVDHLSLVVHGHDGPSFGAQLDDVVPA